MPWNSMEKVPASLKGIRPPISLAQANEIAAMADAMDGVENPWPVAISSWKRGHEVRDGAWIKRPAQAAEAAEADPEVDYVEFDPAQHKDRMRFFMRTAKQTTDAIIDGIMTEVSDMTPADAALFPGEVFVLAREG